MLSLPSAIVVVALGGAELPVVVSVSLKLHTAMQAFKLVVGLSLDLLGVRRPPFHSAFITAEATGRLLAGNLKDRTAHLTSFFIGQRFATQVPTTEGLDRIYRQASNICNLFTCCASGSHLQN